LDVLKGGNIALYSVNTPTTNNRNVSNDLCGARTTVPGRTRWNSSKWLLPIDRSRVNCCFQRRRLHLNQLQSTFYYLFIYLLLI